MDDQNRLSFFSETTKNMKSLLGKQGLFQRYIKELYDETKDETFQQISKFVRINCKYLLKYFGEYKDQFNQCGGRHNEYLTSLYQAKDYLDIDSKVNGKDIFVHKADKIFIEKGDKVLIKRKILNDYMSIINKRQSIVDDIEGNFIALFEMHEGTLQYYNKYYSKQNKKRYQRLLNLLIPEFRYILKFVTNKGRQFESRLRNYSDIKYDKQKSKIDESYNKRSTSFGYQNQSLFAKKKDKQNKREDQSFDSAILDQIELNYEIERQKYQSLLEKKALLQKQKFEHLAKSKGYFYLENSDNLTSKCDSYEAAKFGTDKMKQRIFEKDMKQIIKENKIQLEKEAIEKQNSQQTEESEEVKMKKLRRKLYLEKKKRQKELLQNVKDTIQSFKRLSVQSQFLQDLLTDKSIVSEKEQQQKSQKIPTQNKIKLSSEQKLQYINKKQSFQSIDFGIDSNIRLNSKTNLSSLYQLKQYQTFKNQPMILKDDVSFKKFKEKYFFQKDNQNDGEIKPYIQQLSTKELKSSNTLALPLTINELKASLVNQFLSLNNKPKKASFSDNESITSQSKSTNQQILTLNTSFDKKKDGQQDSGNLQTKNQTEGKIGSRVFQSSTDNSQKKDQDQVDYQERQQFNYYSSQQKNKEQKQKQQESYVQKQYQPIELPKEDIFIFKKLNKIYLEKFYQEKILNQKSQQNIQPLYSLEDINKVKEKSQQQRNSIILSRSQKSIPYLSEIFGSNKTKKDSKANIRLPSVADFISGQNQGYSQNDRNYLQTNFVNSPSLEFQEYSSKKNSFNQNEQNQRLQIQTNSFQALAIDLDINTQEYYQDPKSAAANMSSTPQTNFQFDFNPINTINEEDLSNRSASFKKKINGDFKQFANKINNQDSNNTSSQSSVSSSDLQMQQPLLSQEKKISIQLYDNKPFIQKPQHKQNLSYDSNLNTNIEKKSGKIDTENGDFYFKKKNYTIESQCSPINASMSTNMSNSQGIQKLLLNDKQVYPTQSDFVKEKKTKGKINNSISFLSTKISTQPSQPSQNYRRKLNQSINSPVNFIKSSVNTPNLQNSKDVSPSNQQIFNQKIDQQKNKQNILLPPFQLFNKKEKIQQEQQMKQFNNSINNLSQKIISQQFDLHKLNDKFYTKQKQSSKLFNILNKKYDICIDKKEKSFNQYIKQINSPILDQVTIIQKEKLQERLTPFEIFKLDKELKPLDRQKQLEKLNQYSQQAGIENRELRFISRKCSQTIDQTDLNLQQNLKKEQNQIPQNAIDLILKLKKSKQFVSPQKTQLLTEKWNLYENQSQQYQSKS